ncbi:hypothetical protein P7K49_033842 [Saguinus oedipus]|uniref:PLAC domain-containing protein n=1 Tax=Saguinus oedipus TaxID=9490 RepID=A0ABQ9TT25_SAGOE|nr:hypothetical protein P7K49_033842 [Saguinus oedipus]
MAHEALGLQETSAHQRLFSNLGGWPWEGVGQRQPQLEMCNSGSGAPPETGALCIAGSCWRLLKRDRLSFGFCETLCLVGRCQLPTVCTQCCRSCPPPSHGTPSRGHQWAAHR